jgi:hypothetical protein
MEHGAGPKALRLRRPSLPIIGRVWTVLPAPGDDAGGTHGTDRRRRVFVNSIEQSFRIRTGEIEMD